MGKRQKKGAVCLFVFQRRKIGAVQRGPEKREKEELTFYNTLNFDTILAGELGRILGVKEVFDQCILFIRVLGY